MAGSDVAPPDICVGIGRGFLPDVFGTVGAQGTGVDLGAPAQGEFSDGGTVRSAYQDPPSRRVHRISEPVGTAPRRRFVVRSVRAVETYDSVHVDGRPLLVLRNTGGGEPRVRREV